MIGLGKHIVNFTAIYFKEVVELTKKPLNVNEDFAFKFHLIDKIFENFSGIGKLLELSEQNSMAYLRHPVMILLRSSLSDVLILY